MPALYIADGHHRYETAINYRNYLRENGLAKEGDACDYVMMMLVEMDNEGLVVFPTHRLIRDLEGFDEAKSVWGGDLPGLCSDTYDMTMKKLDEWAEEAGLNTVSQ